MLDSEELAVRIIAEERYEIEVITKFYKSNVLRDANSSSNGTIDEASVFDILDQAESVSSVIRRTLYVVVNPIVIVLGILLSFQALVLSVRAAAAQRPAERKGRSTLHSGAPPEADRPQLWCSLGLIHYYLSLHFLSCMVYLLVCGLSWLYFWSAGQHISAYNNFSCRIWQFLVRVFHELSIWMLIPPSWIVWCHLKNGHHASLYGKSDSSNRSSKREETGATSECRAAQASPSARSQQVDLSTNSNAGMAGMLGAALRAPILAQLLVGVLCSFVMLLHMHGIWSHSLSAEHYGASDSARRCATHRNTGVFFIRIWPLIRFAIAAFAPTLLLVTLVAMATVLSVRSGNALRAQGRAWGGREAFVVQYVALWAGLLRLQWCFVNVYTGALLLQSPYAWTTKVERGINFVLIVSQTTDMCAMLLCPLALCFVRRAAVWRKFCSLLGNRKTPSARSLHSQRPNEV